MEEFPNEQVFIQNLFGTVTDKRVIYFRSKGWFKGGSREDIPMKHVTSVRFETARNIILGLFLIVLGLFTLFFIFGIVFIFFGVLYLWGSPTVTVNTAGGDLSASKGWPWQKASAEDFVNSLRKQLFKD